MNSMVRAATDQEVRGDSFQRMRAGCLFVADGWRRTTSHGAWQKEKPPGGGLGVRCKTVTKRSIHATFDG